MWVRIALVVVSWIISRALAPRPKPPDVPTADVPETKDGYRFRRIYGTVWITDPVVLAMRKVGEDAIRKSGGKK